MEVTFWGVRGSIASSGPETVRFGGNTTCLEVREGTHRLILDAGTGLRLLGQRLLAEGRPVEATLLFSHLHWDHIQGFPFFTPAFLPSTALSFYGPLGDDGAFALEDALARQMDAPSFPVPLAAMACERRFAGVSDGDRVEVGPFRIRARNLNHPQGCLGYRIEAGGHRICFATDTEHLEDDSVHDGLLDLARDVDLLVLDAQYTPGEYEGKAGPSRRGWGHSTHAAAARIATRVGARRLALFHHDPGHDDAFVGRMEREARSLFQSAFAAREGLAVDL